ncbi:MAG: GTPase HflX [Flavobacteriales bacterium]|nr:GTPase HflX [Flavobacteriales bacterium]
MKKMHETKAEEESAVLISLITQDIDEEIAKEHLDELSFLALTAGAHEQKRFTQKREKPHPATFVGTGKLEEIRAYIVENETDMVIFDDELSPTQLRNIEKEFNVKVLDRSNLILDIFAGRAQTAHAKTQVELAQYQYLLPRLTRMWTHLERQKGGIGMRGPGETQIETDRRIIQQKIALLKEKLVKIDKQKASQRGNRGAMVRVALVGYTNAGKSTIMNMMSKSEVLAEDKLFATLDTTVRKITLHNVPLLLSDTVGFIRKLPHQLVESFKSTLDEVREADILLHVVDISHENFEDQYAVVNETLRDIDSLDKPTILIFNKIDALKKKHAKKSDLPWMEEPDFSLDDLKNSWMSKMAEDDDVVFISATEKENITELKELLYEKVKKIHAIRFPYNTFLY